MGKVDEEFVDDCFEIALELLLDGVLVAVEDENGELRWFAPEIEAKA